MSSEITFWLLLISDIVLLGIVFYRIYLFRKDTLQFEKHFRKQYEPKKMSVQNRNALIFLVLVIVIIAVCRINTPSAFL